MFTDSDRAGNETTRKSTSGGCVMLGKHQTSHWSKVHINVGLNSDEVELNAAVQGTLLNSLASPSSTVTWR